MTRAQRVAFGATLASILYFLILFQVFEIPFVDEAVVAQILPVLPWWLLVAFGSYSLWSLGWGLVTFRDCPEAYNELLLEISEAKNDLRTKGVSVD
ncbi:dolichol-phosphate mannosyltransferase subunit 3 [Dendrothele bispora CBS 962.96]|uniref:Dolichol-phosphate mannosyltransferase subunit 3 n=1 Tax=Dendrothele bispora (strain CBS 962.96) TaxID=1314807 RepID=A0A4V4HIP5_DENBC|nr:dolichol-phosphate mannosyltransferase subunit 3 [Dendrothele bispora CBS 962.96]